jgi:hypothetical protein
LNSVYSLLAYILKFIQNNNKTTKMDYYDYAMMPYEPSYLLRRERYGIGYPPHLYPPMHPMMPRPFAAADSFILHDDPFIYDYEPSYLHPHSIYPPTRPIYPNSFSRLPYYDPVMVPRPMMAPVLLY